MITEHQNSHHGDHESIYHYMILEALRSIIICTGGTKTFIAVSVDGRSHNSGCQNKISVYGFGILFV